MSPPKKPPLIITDEHDWAQYRRLVEYFIEDMTAWRDATEERLRAMWIKLASINALVTAAVVLATQLIVYYLTRKQGGP